MSKPSSQVDYARDSKRMFGADRMFLKKEEKDSKPKDIKIAKASVKPMDNKRDLRFLYNILYNDKKRIQNGKLEKTYYQYCMIQLSNIV